MARRVDRQADYRKVVAWSVRMIASIGKARGTSQLRGELIHHSLSLTEEYL